MCQEAFQDNKHADMGFTTDETKITDDAYIYATEMLKHSLW